MSRFNRIVLEQVARDGIIYKSLAKEMAEHLLKQETFIGNLPTEIRLMLAGDNDTAEELSKKDPDVPVYTFRVSYQNDAKGDPYSIYILTRRTV